MSEHEQPEPQFVLVDDLQPVDQELTVLDKAPSTWPGPLLLGVLLGALAAGGALLAWHFHEASKQREIEDLRHDLAAIDHVTDYEEQLAAEKLGPQLERLEDLQGDEPSPDVERWRKWMNHPAPKAEPSRTYTTDNDQPLHIPINAETLDKEGVTTLVTRHPRLGWVQTSNLGVKYEPATDREGSDALTVHADDGTKLSNPVEILIEVKDAAYKREIADLRKRLALIDRVDSYGDQVSAERLDTEAERLAKLLPEPSEELLRWQQWLDAPPPSTPPNLFATTTKNTPIEVTAAGLEDHAFHVVNAPSNGRLTPIEGGFRYEPASGFTGDDTFTFRTSKDRKFSPEGSGLIQVVDMSLGGGVTVSQRNVTFRVIDHGDEDGDTINFIVNGQVLLRDHMLTNAGTNVVANLVQGRNTVVIQAISTGTSGPNTASVNISNVKDGDEVKNWELEAAQTASFDLVAY